MQDDTTLTNAKTAASAAVDYIRYRAWVNGGTDPNEDLSPSEEAIAYLTQAQTGMLEELAGVGKAEGLKLHEERAQHALSHFSTAEVAVLARAWEKATEEINEQRGGGVPPSGNAFGPVPPPRSDDDNGPKP